MKSLMMITVVCMAFLAHGQKITVDQYIDTYKYIAMEEMQSTGIPASIKLAQGILESRYGNSELSLNSNNHFGIKCHTGWTGRRYYHDDDRKQECFRVYKDPSQSWRDHSEFLTGRSRYAFLFSYDSDDYKNWAHGLKKAGYATNPSYAKLLIDLIERHQLNRFDQPGYIAIAMDEDRSKNSEHYVASNRGYKVNDATVVKGGSQMDEVSSMQTFSYNRIRTVVVKKHDSPMIIASRFDIPTNRLMKYNDLKPFDKLEEGSFIYLQPKRRKSRQRTHAVQQGETMWSISQLHGIRLDKLFARNLMVEGQEPAIGSTLFLNQKRPDRPKIRQVGDDIMEPVSKPVAKEPAESKQSEGVRVVIPVAPEKQPEVAKTAEREVIEVHVEEPVAKELPVAQKTEVEVQKTVASSKESAIRFHIVRKGDTLYSISKKYGLTVEQLKTWNNLNNNLLSIDQKLMIQQ